MKIFYDYCNSLGYRCYSLRKIDDLLVIFRQVRRSALSSKFSEESVKPFKLSPASNFSKVPSPKKSSSSATVDFHRGSKIFLKANGLL